MASRIQLMIRLSGHGFVIRYSEDNKYLAAANLFDDKGGTEGFYIF